jgi:hypothetical protein
VTFSNILYIFTHKKPIERYFSMTDWFAKTSPNGDIENRTLLASAATNKLYAYIMKIPDDQRLNLIKTA